MLVVDGQHRLEAQLNDYQFNVTLRIYKCAKMDDFYRDFKFMNINTVIPSGCIDYENNFVQESILRIKMCYTRSTENVLTKVILFRSLDAVQLQLTLLRQFGKVREFFMNHRKDFEMPTLPMSCQDQHRVDPNCGRFTAVWTVYITKTDQNILRPDFISSSQRELVMQPDPEPQAVQFALLPRRKKRQTIPKSLRLKVMTVTLKMCQTKIYRELERHMGQMEVTAMEVLSV